MKTNLLKPISYITIGILSGIAFLIFQENIFAQDILSTFGANNVQGVGVGGTDTALQTQDKLMDVIKKAINRGLGMLSFVALVILLIGGFKIVTAGEDSGKVDEGFAYLKNAAIGLIFIGVSRLMVSFILWFVNYITTTP